LPCPAPVTGARQGARGVAAAVEILEEAARLCLCSKRLRC
jgi:hypothetical protein